MRNRNLVGEKKSLTVAIPVRWANERGDILERLAFPMMERSLPGEVEILIVDDGSPTDLGRRLRSACEKHGYLYHRLATEHLPFSIGRARNAAAQCGVSPYLMFQDVDLMPYPGFYGDVLRECEVAGLNESADNFLMIGVIYLTEQATADFKNTPPDLRRQKFIHCLLEDDKAAIEKFSTGTSVTVWRRDYFLATGGNDMDFNGWGYEDLEYACRAIRRRKKFALPSEFALDYRNFQSIVEYKGWKSIYRLFGDMTFQKGIVMFHAWHPVESNSRYMAAKKRNRQIFDAKFAAFRDHGLEPDPLPILGSGRSLVLRNNPWVTNRWAAPFLGELVHIDEDHLPPDTFIDFLASAKFTRVVFHNPYANERVQALYEQVRKQNFPYIVVERGALPDSVFFDARGFNADSESYHERHWNHPVTEKERVSTLQYIQSAIVDDDSLEEQPDRLGANNLRKKLKIPRGKKALVAFLQRPTDTVIQNFMGALGSYENFIRLLSRLPYAMPPDWVLLVKQHPLETEKIKIPGALTVDDYNTKDLLELGDAMIAVNSGVGVLGIIFGKRVLYCGEAFYGTEGLARQVVDEEEVNAALRGFTPDVEKSLRFINYLVNKFYSFGKFTTRRVKWHDGSLMTATTDIDFYKLRIPGHPEMKRAIRDSVEVASTSILFDRYRLPNNELDRGLAPPAKEVKEPPKASARAPGAALPPKIPDQIREKPAQRQEPAVGKLLAKPAPTPRKKNGFLKKLRKLSESPVMFFRDSRFHTLRLIGNRFFRQ